MGLGLWVAIGVNAVLVLLALSICAARYFQCLLCHVKRSSEKTIEAPPSGESHGEESRVSAQESSSAAAESNADHEVAEPSAGGESSADHDVSIVA